MNAFLSVKINQLPVESMEDITTNDMTIALWKDDSMEEFIKSSKVYKRAEADGRIFHISSTGHGVRSMIEDEATVLLEYQESVEMFREDYPCQFDKVL